MSVNGSVPAGLSPRTACAPVSPPQRLPARRPQASRSATGRRAVRPAPEEPPSRSKSQRQPRDLLDRPRRQRNRTPQRSSRYSSPLVGPNIAILGPTRSIRSHRQKHPRSRCHLYHRCHRVSHRCRRRLRCSRPRSRNRRSRQCRGSRTRFWRRHRRRHRRHHRCHQSTRHRHRRCRH